MRMTPRTIVIGGLAVVLSVVAVVVFLPIAVFKPAPTITTVKYTALEEEGLELYKSNGCMYCHSQFTRLHDHNPSRVSRAGDYVYDQPHQLGTLRTGPDLANIGFKRGDRWEMDHLLHPREFTPNSIMPSFSFLSEHQLQALVAYLNRKGTKRNATTDLMIPAEYDDLNQPFELDIKTWTAGRKIYAEKCLTCHGCAGKGDGPYAYMNNARPADLRQPRFKGLDANFFFWRLREGVPGTVMPQWEKSLSQRQIWQVIAFVQGAFMDSVPHFTDEGDMPAAYAKLADPLQRNDENTDAGKALFNMNCAFCHGYGGMGDGPDAAGLQPAAPNLHDTPTYQAWTAPDYFWRVSESIPMRAMPQWKYLLDENQRWLVANYVRDTIIFPPAEAEPVDPVVPQAVKALTMPENADIMKGREVYLKRCFTCHGDAGQGEGPSSVILRPTPANFTDPDVDEIPDSELFWKVTMGLGNSAMPQWGLLLSEQDRWNALLYVKKTFVAPSEPKDVSDELPAQYGALESPYEDSPHAREQGKLAYESFCSECHGSKGTGDGQYGPALMPTPANLTEDPAKTSPADWWYWRLDQGVVGFDGATPHPTAMPAWRLILTDEKKWDIIHYARPLVGSVDATGGAQ